MQKRIQKLSTESSAVASEFSSALKLSSEVADLKLSVLRFWNDANLWNAKDLSGLEPYDVYFSITLPGYHYLRERTGPGTSSGDTPTALQERTDSSGDTHTAPDTDKDEDVDEDVLSIPAMAWNGRTGQTRMHRAAMVSGSGFLSSASGRQYLYPSQHSQQQRERERE